MPQSGSQRWSPSPAPPHAQKALILKRGSDGYAGSGGLPHGSNQPGGLQSGEMRRLGETCDRAQPLGRLSIHVAPIIART
jgi:hypothetical protein